MANDLASRLSTVATQPTQDSTASTGSDIASRLSAVASGSTQENTPDVTDKMPSPKEILDTAVSPSTYTSYFKNVIDQTKQQWAAGQEWRDREAAVAKGVTEAVKKGDFGGAAEILIPHLENAAKSVASRGYENFKENIGVTPPSDPNRVLGGPIMPIPGVGSLAGEFADEVASAVPSAARTVAAEPAGMVQKITQGKEIAQPQAQTALSTAAKSGAKEAGASTVAPQSLRESLGAPIDSIESAAKQNYQAIDEATGGKFQPNADRLANVNNKLKSIAGTDDAKEAELVASKTRLEWQQEKLFDEAASKGVPKEVVDTARGQFKQAQAMHDLDTKVFKNPNIVSGNIAHGTEETVNVDGAIKALQKLQDNTEFGSPRLEQAVGKQGAKQLMDDMYAAQRLGVKSLQTQELAKMIGKYVGLPIAGAAAGAAAYSVLK